MSDYDASIAITTHNRKEILPACIDSCLAQSLGERLQIVVVDDGSSDGTTEFLTERYGDRPNVKLDRMHPGIGLIAERSRFADLVDAPIIVSIDDDAVFPSPNTVEQALGQFGDDRVGAVAIPYIDVLKDDKAVRQRAPDASTTWVTSQYRGTAHALRVDLFEKAGRYRGQLWRQNEETDYCIRLLDAGGFVALGTADPIHHMESPKRSKPEISRYLMRNLLWGWWWNVPMPWMLPQMAVTTLNCTRVALLDPSRLVPTAHGFCQALAGILGAERANRAPVSPAAYRTFMKLRRGKPMRIDDAAALLARGGRA